MEQVEFVNEYDLPIDEKDIYRVLNDGTKFVKTVDNLFVIERIGRSFEVTVCDGGEIPQYEIDVFSGDGALGDALDRFMFSVMLHRGYYEKNLLVESN